MDNYVEIQILPDPEFSTNTLMNVLFEKLHLALVQGNHDDIGVSFPQARKTMGDVVRIHGSREALQRLMDQRWDNGMCDYIKVSEIRPAPEKSQHRMVRRVQAKSSLDRIYRRSIKKGWLTAQEAEQRVAEGREVLLNSPFIQMRSQSTGQKYRLFIEQGDIQDTSQKGSFSTYGLSNEATVPWF